jgi:hypothetical protein
MTRVLNWPLQWNGTCVGLTVTMKWQVCWTDRYNEMTRVLDWPLQWNDTCVGLTGTMKWHVCWTYWYNKMTRVLDWMVQWNDTVLYCPIFLIWVRNVNSLKPPVLPSPTKNNNFLDVSFSFHCVELNCVRGPRWIGSIQCIQQIMLNNFIYFLTQPRRSKQKYLPYQ